jgi:hypothetical protein
MFIRMENGSLSGSPQQQLQQHIYSLYPTGLLNLNDSDVNFARFARTKDYLTTRLTIRNVLSWPFLFVEYSIADWDGAQ